MPTVFITGADRGLGFALTETFVKQGWRVFAGSYLPEWEQLVQLATLHPTQVHIVPLDIASDDSVKDAAAMVQAQTDTVDIVINNAAVSTPFNERDIRSGLDYDDILRVFEVNTLGALRITEAFVPLLINSGFKRLCYISSEAGSITRSERTAWYGYCMSKAALNQGVRHLFSALRPSGYSFRLFHPGWMRTYMSGTRNEKRNSNRKWWRPSPMNTSSHRRTRIIWLCGTGRERSGNGENVGEAHRRETLPATVN